VYAIDYLDAALALKRSQTPIRAAKTYLACHSIELALSAYLSLRGRSTDTLGRGLLEHDLAQLLHDAESSGLSEVAQLTKGQRRQIKEAAPYYSKMVFQYPAVAEAVRGYPGAPNVPVLLATATVLISAVRELIGTRG